MTVVYHTLPPDTKLFSLHYPFILWVTVMVQIPSANAIADKWERRASSAQDEFTEGVERSSDQEWSESTIAAESAWEQGIQRAAQNDLYIKGVRNTSKSWEQRTLTLGPRRYSEGVRESEEEYQQGFAPYREVIANTDLPARGPRGDIDTNIERVRVIAQALTNERMNG